MEPRCRQLALGLMSPDNVQTRQAKQKIPRLWQKEIFSLDLATSVFCTVWPFHWAMAQTKLCLIWKVAVEKTLSRAPRQKFAALAQRILHCCEMYTDPLPDLCKFCMTCGVEKCILDTDPMKTSHVLPAMSQPHTLRPCFGLFLQNRSQTT